MNSVALLAIAALSQASPTIQRYEGDWYISDITDNITGEREVDAMRMHLEPSDPDYVTVRMRCLEGKPTLLVQWTGQNFPDQTVLTIAASKSDEDIEGTPYIFEKSTDPVDGGLRASPDVSRAVVAAIGRAKYATVTAHLGTSNRSVGLEVNGAQEAWSRVSRHCPIRLMALPTP